MSMRRYRSGSQLEPSSKDFADSFYSLGRIFTPFGSREMNERAARNWKKVRIENESDMGRPRSGSLPAVMRRSSFIRHRVSVDPVRSYSPVHSYLPGIAVGYKRLWMQENPWPDLLFAPKRESAQDHLHRMKFRDHRRHVHGHGFVPGGNCQDPLNLKAADTGEELAFLSLSPIPVPHPDRYMPVNNFIPINQQDPLGLTQDEDNQMPVALKYPLRSKRKRSRCKRKENVSDSSASNIHSHSGNADNLSTTSEMLSTEQAKDGGDSDGHHRVVSADSDMMQTVNNEPSEACSPVKVHVREIQNPGLDSLSGQKSAADEMLLTSKLSSEPLDNKCVASSTETSVNQSVSVSDSYCVLSGNNGIQSSASNVGKGDDDVCDHVNSAHDSDQHPVCDKAKLNVADLINSETQELRKKVPAAHPKNWSTSQPQSSHGSERSRKMKHELDQKLKELQKRALSLKSLYPVPQSPLDNTDREHVASIRKSLKKALRIEPFNPEEQAKVNKEREKKDREFKRIWRYPNLKSPEEKDDEKDSAGQRLTVEELKVDVNVSPEKTQQGTRLVRGQLSRTVDSIISPVLRPDPAAIRKRRRTISECNTEYAAGPSKKLVFRRSSSPDVRSTPSPKKIRRQTSGSGQTEQKMATEEKRQSSVKFAKNAAYKHGNYYRYYGYRTPAMAPDFRLYFFRNEWFEGKDVLDVGCNAGDVTLAVAQLFHPKKIVGMDIDPNLIRIARQNIRSHQTKANLYQMEKYPVSTNEYGPIEPLPALTNPSNIFPKNVMFMQGNYVLKSDEELDHVTGEYDTILALSITKWIHLNHGDEGLKRVFHRMFQQLRPGGRLILEPQTWASYRRRKKLSATIYKNYNSIQLKPNDFPDYLVNTVGFCRREFLGQPFNPSKGFQRPLWLFTKYKGTTENSPSPEGSSNQMEPPSGQYSISERMTYLAGYSPYRNMPDFHGPAGPPCTSSPALMYPSRYVDNNPYLRCPPLSTSSSYSELIHVPWGEESGARYWEQSPGQNQSEAGTSTATSSRQGATESLNSSSDSTASSSCLNESHMSTGSRSCSLQQVEPSQCSVQEPPYTGGQDMGGENQGGVMEWQEEGQFDLGQVGETSEQQEDGLCNGDLHSDLPEEPACVEQYSPDLAVVGGDGGELASGSASGEPALGYLPSIIAGCAVIYGVGVPFEENSGEEESNPLPPPEADLMPHQLPAEGDQSPPQGNSPGTIPLALHERASVEGRTSVLAGHHLVQHPEVSSSQESPGNPSPPFRSYGGLNFAYAWPFPGSSPEGNNPSQQVLPESSDQSRQVCPWSSFYSGSTSDYSPFSPVYPPAPPLYPPQSSPAAADRSPLNQPEASDLSSQISPELNNPSLQMPPQGDGASPQMSPSSGESSNAVCPSSVPQPVSHPQPPSDSADPSSQPDSSLSPDTVG